LFRSGRSKGARLPPATLISTARVLTDYWQFTAADTLLHALPIYHTHGLFVACHVMFLAGGSMVFLPQFDLDAGLDVLPRGTAIMGSPSCHTGLLHDDRRNRAAPAP